MEKISFENNVKKDLSQEEIQAFKKKYDDVVLIKSSDGKKKCYLHTPDRLILDAAESISTQTKKGSKYAETIIKNCWLAGDKEMLTVDHYFYGASKHIGSLVKITEAELEKL